MHESKQPLSEFPVLPQSVCDYFYPICQSINSCLLYCVSVSMHSAPFLWCFYVIIISFFSLQLLCLKTLLPSLYWFFFLTLFSNQSGILQDLWSVRYALFTTTISFSEITDWRFRVLTYQTQVFNSALLWLKCQYLKWGAALNMLMIQLRWINFLFFISFLFDHQLLNSFARYFFTSNYFTCLFDILCLQ